MHIMGYTLSWDIIYHGISHDIYSICLYIYFVRSCIYISERNAKTKKKSEAYRAKEMMAQFKNMPDELKKDFSAYIKNLEFQESELSEANDNLEKENEGEFQAPIAEEEEKKEGEVEEQTVAPRSPRKNRKK
jgi:hypothetical protein